MTTEAPVCRFERREHPRREWNLPLSILSSEQAPVDDGSALRDVSVRGICFETVATLHPGDQFCFKLDIPGQGAVAGTARTRWARIGDTGFTHVYGAEIEQMGWKHSHLLRRALWPPARGVQPLFDAALVAGNLVIWAMAVKELQAYDPAFAQLILSRFSAASVWLPQAFVAAAVLGAIVVFFRNLLR